MKSRIFVEADPNQDIQATQLRDQLSDLLSLKTLKNVRIINVYDLYEIDEVLSEDEILPILANPLTEHLLTHDDIVTDLEKSPHFAIEALPGQYDQRADILQETFYLKGVPKEAQLSTAILYLFNDDLNHDELELIQNYLFNPIDTRLKNILDPINPTRYLDSRTPSEVPRFHDFIHMTPSKLTEFRLDHGLAMEFEDLRFIQKYFKEIEKRNPTETEILVLDTYWSDHCRHTTFETALTNITFDKSQFETQLQAAYEEYLALRNATNINDRPQTLMDMGTIVGRYQRQTGELADMEVSNEVNACSVKINVDVDGIDEPWLLMFKNETHNHPTEIEPFGGASTCVGGAIRDPLSGRAYVYQAMRITGAGDVLEPISTTLEGKLPQRKITLDAARGNSSYANQIGSATASLKEYYHPGFVAKRMELGAVVGAVPEYQVVREEPTPGDLVIMLGGKTGRDGVGGATGSSQVQTLESIETAGSEVQKGSPVEERKILRLFRDPIVTKMIKKSNDFGAGGVSVAIGELADGVDINLDVVPTKYAGLNGTELAISESQERMAVVVSADDAKQFIEMAEAESIEAVIVATVTEDPRLVIRWQGDTIVDISREFLDTNGIRKESEAIVVDSNRPSPLLLRKPLANLKESWIELMAEYNHASQKGLQNQFDSTLGRSTVLLPYGGQYQLSAAESSVQKIQTVSGVTNTVSILSHGYNPYIGEWSPFHGAAYAVIESVGRIVATGGNWKNIRFSFQEYFERLDNNPEKFGKPVAALLGSIAAQKAFNLPSIGGKDSMSGSFNDLHVPPTLVSFAVVSAKVDDILSTEFKETDHYLYLLSVPEKPSNEIDYATIIQNYETFQQLKEEGNITAAISIRSGGVAEALAIMSFGNRIGAKIDAIDKRTLFRPQYGALLFTTSKPLPESDRYILIGQTTKEYAMQYDGEYIDGIALEEAYSNRFESLFPTFNDEQNEVLEPIKNVVDQTIQSEKMVKNPIVYIPVFPGTHSEYDCAKAFEKEGATVHSIPFKTLTSEMIEQSINEMVMQLDQSHIFVLSGGFVTTDEPQIGHYMATVLTHERVKEAIERFIERGGLIVGFNSGFAALIETGLLPYGEYRDHATLSIVANASQSHMSTMSRVKIINRQSPWLNEVLVDEQFILPLSTANGRLMGDQETLNTLIEQGQIVAQYVDMDGEATMESPHNPTGSALAIDALQSSNGQILGMMTQPERYEAGLFKNIDGNRELPIFRSAVNYFKRNQ